MSEITFEQEGAEPVFNPTWEFIENAIRRITPRRPGFFILSRPDGSYVQNEILTVGDAIEIFRHFYTEGTAPASYAMREDTDRFL